MVPSSLISSIGNQVIKKNSSYLWSLKNGSKFITLTCKFSPNHSSSFAKLYSTIVHKPAVVVPTESDENSQAMQEIQKNSNLNKKNLIGIPREELIEEFQSIGVPKFKAAQIFYHMYVLGASSIGDFWNSGKSLMDELSNRYFLDGGSAISDLVASDGTRKWLIDMAVFIPETKRGTLCVSSQIGCTMSCTFCHTGTQPLMRNLNASEIIQQVITAKRLMYDFSGQPNRIVSNIVFMGQGEPFYNYRNVKKAIQVLTDETGLGISKRRITVSTSGIVPNIKRLGNDFPGINLAISLHAVNDQLRSEIVPANRQWPISELLDACKNFPSLSPMRKIAFEYVMLKGINDSDADARELVRLLKGFPSFVNIIPFNPWPGSLYDSSSNERIKTFAEIIYNEGIEAPIRWPRGRDILAACGQLKSASDDSKKGRKIPSSRRNQNPNINQDHQQTDPQLLPL